MQLTPDDIIIGKRMRPLNAERIADLERSIAAIGLQTPITIRYVEGRPTLIAGAHRLQAVKNLGWSAIAVREFDGDEREARMWEIAENLHRAELTVLEHDDSSPSGSGWPKRFRCKLTQNHKAVVPRAALNKAARELGIEQTAAKRAVKIDSLTPEAKVAAVELGLDDNQSALLQAAKAETADE